LQLKIRQTWGFDYELLCYTHDSVRLQIVCSTTIGYDSSLIGLAALKRDTTVVLVSEHVAEILQHRIY